VLDLKFVVENRERVTERLATRGSVEGLEGLWQLDSDRRKTLQRVEELRHRQ
jgi:seryl-tRNA synthetase